MNLKKTIAMTLVSVAFAMAQEQPDAATAAPAADAAQPAAEAAQPAPAAAPAEAQPVAETQTAEAAQPAQEPAPAEDAKPAETVQPAEQAQVAEPAPAPAVASDMGTAPAPDGAVRMGPPKTPFTVLHGNAYNRVENEAAGDNVNTLLNRSITKMAFNKFFYIEPSGEMGAFSLGGFFGAMDISDSVGKATVGYATPGFGAELRFGLGQFKYETDNADIKQTSAGDSWGVTLSKNIGGYSVSLAGDWTTFNDETNVKPKRGPETEQRFWDIDASFIVTDGPSARKHYWTAGVAFNRHVDETERGGELVDGGLESSVTVVPVFNYGTPVLRSEHANLYLGINTAVPATFFDEVEVRDSTSGNKVKSSQSTVGVDLTPNILGEVLLTESLMLFGEANYQWEVFRYVDSKGVDGDFTLKQSVSDKVEASMGMRYQYKDWAACEFAFGDSFFTDTKSIFNGEGVFVSFGGFIYF